MGGGSRASGGRRELADPLSLEVAEKRAADVCHPIVENLTRLKYSNIQIFTRGFVDPLTPTAVYGSS